MRKYFYEKNKTIEIIKYNDSLTIVNILKFNKDNEKLSTVFYNDSFENVIKKYKNNNLV